MIHDRDAHEDVLRILAEEGPPEQVIFHCFSGDAEMAKRCADAGYVISFAGNADVQERGAAAGGGRGHAARPAAGGDRRAVPHPGAAPGQAELARPGGAHDPRAGRDQADWTWPSCAASSPRPASACSALWSARGDGAAGPTEIRQIASPARRPADQAARPELRHRPEHGPAHRGAGRPRRRTTWCWRWARASARSPSPCCGREPGGRGRARSGAGRRAAAHRRRAARLAGGPPDVLTADALRITELPGQAPTALVANLPYNVAVPVLLHLLATLPSLRQRAGHGAGRGRRPDDRAARAAGSTGCPRSSWPGTPLPAAPGRCRAPCSGRCRTWIRALSPSPAASRRWRTCPARRCSPWWTPRSRSGARRCAPRWPGGPGRRERGADPARGRGRPQRAGRVARGRRLRPNRGRPEDCDSHDRGDS